MKYKTTLKHIDKFLCCLCYFVSQGIVLNTITFIENWSRSGVGYLGQFSAEYVLLASRNPTSV